MNGVGHWRTALSQCQHQGPVLGKPSSSVRETYYLLYVCMSVFAFDTKQMPSTCLFVVIVVGEFYVMGGEGDLADPGVSNKGVYDLVEIYNPILNQWRRGSRMDIGLHGMFPVVVEDRIEILGGGPMFDRGPGFHHEVFAPIWWE
eukprot:m.206616 g.206616  ORF g.206616 m.206616 type:complete len:145 (-) comp13757_c0_seq11:842-1276(-)